MSGRHQRAGCVVTGAGLLSPGGDSAAAMFATLLERKPLALQNGDDKHLPAELPGVPIRGFQPRNYVARKGLKHLSRTSQLACAAAARVGEGLEQVEAADVGVALGSAWASLDMIVRFEREAHLEGARFVDPILFTETVANVPAGQVSIFNGWSAFNATLSSGTSSGIVAICKSMELLAEGRAKLAVAGGADQLNLHLQRTLLADGMLSASRDSLPYARGAAGPVGAEGACLLALESAEHAASRGAQPMCRIEAGVTGFAHEGGNGHGRRVELLERLLDRGALRAEEIDLLVLSGNGNPRRDRDEARAIGAVFGEAATPALLPKAILGESWGASGPLGVVAAIEAARSSRIPGVPEGLEPSEDCAGVHLPGETLESAVRKMVVVDCSETGHFSAIALSARAG